MKKSVYDINDDKTVDNSEKLGGYSSSHFMEKNYVSEYRAFEIIV